MPTLAQIYEEHAEDCIRTAAKTDDPKRRDLLLLASQWRVFREQAPGYLLPRVGADNLLMTFAADGRGERRLFSFRCSILQRSAVCSSS